MSPHAALSPIVKTLLTALAAQIQTTADWHHRAEPGDLPWTKEHSNENWHDLILAQHQRNFQLWHVEDTARRKDVDASLIADCKFRIDRLNQQRNDLIEQVDTCLVALLSPLVPAEPVKRYNTETVGMAIDRLSILALKIFHMREQTERTDVDDAHRASCTHKLQVLVRQRNDLTEAVLDLLADYVEGTKTPLLYHQFKMYNDPALNPELYTKR